MRAVLILLGALLSCSAHGNTSSAPSLIRIIVEEGEKLAAGRIDSTSTVILDPSSLGKLHSLPGGAPIDSGQLTGELRRRIRYLSKELAIQCPGTSGIGCSVVDGGLFIEVDSAAAKPTEIAVYVTYVFTDRRPSGAVATCSLPTLVRFRREGGNWVLLGLSTFRRC